eukprot:Nitzschia sp. Nitz4//scaffold6_size259037//198295//199486//NITZ4_001105-RA/size259037-snap-gene-0.376-mRNA-1//1//CDS//3329556986//7206//frame0
MRFWLVLVCVTSHLFVQVSSFTAGLPLLLDNRLLRNVEGPATSNSHQYRKSTIVRDGKVNVLRDRIRVVESTQKLTSAMKLVAAARVRQAQEAAEGSRPFNEKLQAFILGLMKIVDVDDLDVPLLQPRSEVNKVTLCVLTGDRGLCGGFNSMVIRKAKARYEQLRKMGVDVDMVVVGEKGISHFTSRDFPIRRTFPMGQKPTGDQAEEIRNELIGAYLSGETDTVELVYTKFKSLIASTPSVRTLIPFSKTELTSKGDELFEMTTDGGHFKVERKEHPPAQPTVISPIVQFDSDPSDVMEKAVELYVTGQILRTLLESVAAELAARMQSMQSATDNAQDLAKRLTLEHNRARQTAVTQELLEIVTGANAMAEGD